ncbi:MAG: Holliday junction branch migration DNA helicase RuvB [Planctomycetota bacterium]
MSREPILSAEDATTTSEVPAGQVLSQEEYNAALRPRRMEEMVGQRKVYERLMIAVEAAQIRQEPLGHILLDGPPGLGKTTFATCIPRALDVPLQIASGAALAAPKDLLPYLTQASAGSVLFIDEIHRLPKTVEEFMYPAMEDFRVDITLGEGVSARTVNMTLKPFTIIGATTRTGLLSSPLRDRFQVREHLEFYELPELTEIITRNAGKLKVEIDADAATRIADCSRGTPRIANNRLKWVRDYATTKADGKITVDVANAALQMSDVDRMGLDAQDRKYLDTILRVFQGGPVGVEAIAHTLNTATDTLTDEVEPFLLRAELVVRSPRGRRLTAQGYRHLGVTPPPDLTQTLLDDVTDDALFD